MRTRHQEGWVELRGTRWYGHYYVYEKDGGGKEKRRHKGVALGEKAKLRKWEADQKLRVEIGKACKGIPAGNGVTLAWFTRERFLPMWKPQWAPSTRETNVYHIEHHVLPGLGDMPLSELDKFKCQVFLNNIAKHGFSFTVVDHCRTMLKAILEEAVDADLIGKNPARKVVNPETPEAEKQILPKEQARRLIASMEFRDRIMVMIAAFCAMRPGEIFGLRWSSWHGDHFQIEGTAWRGTLRPGKAKTKQSKAPVAIPDVLVPALRMWRDHNTGASQDALIFASQAGTPMRPENWLRRRVKPFARSAGISVPVNFRVLRRTFATNAQGHGNPKDVQAHLRHTDIGTTLNEYTQIIPESVRKLVNSVADDVMGSDEKLEPESQAATVRLQ
jgi:integrase